jgi:acyl carrier protein
MSEVNRETVAALLSLALARPVSTETDVSRDDCGDWDSLKHVEFVFMVEDRFGIQFPEEVMPLLSSLDRVVAEVERLLAA